MNMYIYIYIGWGVGECLSVVYIVACVNELLVCSLSVVYNSCICNDICIYIYIYMLFIERERYTSLDGGCSGWR